VVDLMVGKLRQLPVQPRKRWQLAACLGNRFELRHLALVSGDVGGEKQEVEQHLAAALRGKLDRAQPRPRQVPARPDPAGGLLTHSEEHRAGGPPAHRPRAVGEHDGGRASPSICSRSSIQLNRGAALITARDEREQLAELNLIAGKRAKASTAYTSALTYLVGGAALLAEDSREHRHELALRAGAEPGGMRVPDRALAEAEQRLTALSARAATTSNAPASPACAWICT